MVAIRDGLLKISRPPFMQTQVDDRPVMSMLHYSPHLIEFIAPMLPVAGTQSNHYCPRRAPDNDPLSNHATSHLANPRGSAANSTELPSTHSPKQKSLS
jgi:hypothetical protein